MPLSLPHQILAAAISLLLACSAPARPAIPPSGWTIEKIAAPWKLQGFEGNLDLSAIASIDGRSVLVGSDELIAVQPGRLDPAQYLIQADPLLPLLPNPSGKQLEIDIEGIAADPLAHCYYITGSHGVGKKKGEFDETRASIFQLPCDPATGQPQPQKLRRTSLMPWLAQSPTFRDHIKQPLQLNGFNIEGLAFRDGKLFFGVRGPNLQDQTFVIETPAEALFSGALPVCTVHSLPIGPARGIRELAALRDGFVVISGNACAEASKKFPVSQTRMDDKVFDVFLWRPGQNPPLSSIGVLPRPQGKAEGILLLQDAPTFADLLVLFDGAADGGAQTYRLTRP